MMKIHSFKFYDKEEDWGIDPILFNDLTLLVGASGVGKTRILNAIKSVSRIASGESLNGIEWEIKFSIDKDTFCWQGSFELKKLSRIVISLSTNSKKGESERPKSAIEYEKIVVNDNMVIDREGTSLTFRGEKSLVPIKAEQSVLTLIPDPLIKKLEEEFKKLIFSDYTGSSQGGRFTILDTQITSNYENIDSLRNSNESSMAKMYWVYKKSKKIFSQIKGDFIDVFPQVEDMKIEPLEDLKKQEGLPAFIKASPFFQFKEAESSIWIPLIDMSAGMYRTLIHIVELYLSSNGTVILIDEFENSLGVNCIDELTTAMKGATNRIQFIITSHHPYIINSISYNNWKIVTRKGKLLVAQDAQELNFGKSKHDAFIQLINLPAYQTGIQV